MVRRCLCVFSNAEILSIFSTTGNVSPNLCDIYSCFKFDWVEDKTWLVLIILRKAPMEVILVTIWALPVHASVTVITGQENSKKSSKEAKKCPHERSYLTMA